MAHSTSNADVEIKPHTHDQVDISLAQQIWTRYSNQAGVISSQPSKSLFDRIQRWSSRRFPLLADLQARHPVSNMDGFSLNPTLGYQKASTVTHPARLFQSVEGEAGESKNDSSTPNLAVDNTSLLPPALLPLQGNSHVMPFLEAQTNLPSQPTAEMGPAIQRHSRARLSDETTRYEGSLAGMPGEHPSLTLAESSSPGNGIWDQETKVRNEQFQIAKNASLQPPSTRPSPVIQRQAIPSQSGASEQPDPLPYFRKETEQRDRVTDLPIVKVNRVFQHRTGGDQAIQPLQLRLLPSPTPIIVGGQASASVQARPNVESLDSSANLQLREQNLHKADAQELPLAKANGFLKGNDSIHFIESGQSLSRMTMAHTGRTLPIIQAKAREMSSISHQENPPPVGEAPAHAMPASAALVNKADVDLEEITDKVLKKILHYLAVENERRGRSR